MLPPISTKPSPLDILKQQSQPNMGMPGFPSQKPKVGFPGMPPIPKPKTGYPGVSGFPGSTQSASQSAPLPGQPTPLPNQPAPLPSQTTAQSQGPATKYYDYKSFGITDLPGTNVQKIWNPVTDDVLGKNNHSGFATSKDFLVATSEYISQRIWDIRRLINNAKPDPVNGKKYVFARIGGQRWDAYEALAYLGKLEPLVKSALVKSV